MKRFLLLALVCLIGAFSLVSCGAPQVSDSPSTESAVPAQGGQADTTGKKIGVIFYGKDDSLGAAVYSTLNYTAEVLGVDIQWKAEHLPPEGQITAAENMIAAGCDGILCIPETDIVVQKISKLCSEKGVYFGTCFRTINDEQIKADAEANPYFVGGCYEDEVAAGKKMIEIMAEKGRKNLGVGYMFPSSALALRNTGFDKGIASTGSKKLAEYTVRETIDLDETTSTVNNFVNSFSDLDGLIWSTGSVGQGETITNVLRTIAPNGKVSLATFDVFDGMGEAFANGSLSVAAGGMSPDALMSFMMLYNAVIGTPLSDSANYLPQNYIFVTSQEEGESYEKYIDNPKYMIYDKEEIRNMSRANNPDFDIEAMKKLMADYTMENIIAKANKK